MSNLEKDIAVAQAFAKQFDFEDHSVINAEARRIGDLDRMLGLDPDIVISEVSISMKWRASVVEADLASDASHTNEFFENVVVVQLFVRDEKVLHHSFVGWDF